ncbi:MAG: Lrp/AsnC family transcriptional regulator [Actinomycetota bacterium]|nr:MAG: Lrp/AsnC family transcriptional regulator [Actinomycetota bacterium]
MKVRAFILIQTEIGFSAPVAKQCQELQNTVSVDQVTGPYDVIVIVECSSIEELGMEVVAQIQMIQGVTRTLTCPSVHLIKNLAIAD